MINKKHDVTDRPRLHPDRCAGSSSPGGWTVTPSNNFLPYAASSIYVGVLGDITIVGLDGTELTYLGYLGRIPVVTVKVLESSDDGVLTTATHIVAEW